MKQFDLFSGDSPGKGTQYKSTTESSNADVFEGAVSNQVTKRNRRRLLPDINAFFDGELHYFPDFLNRGEADALFAVLRSQLQWQPDQVKVYGKWHTIPRLQAWYGNPESHYSYSGKTLNPLPPTPELEVLRKACGEIAQVEFNSVLANLYRNGADCMGMHSDDEPELGEQPAIASVTLGATRRFDLVHKTEPVKLQLPLQSGSLLLMCGDTQKHWQHGIARTKQPVGERINLTFRRVVKR
ncbi:alpha-ketoglutarate-dependent dioxygenase AlkB family protein [Planctobacterium marinum]|uniref:Alkylated DNA repair protein n=1 Tax=Planctobacterium marinum TaxID=1631968 RepID=A0AA48HEC9_9ALTE|nr:alkylated DNA repair protein [Planctobacterium marinum]